VDVGSTGADLVKPTARQLYGIFGAGRTIEANSAPTTIKPKRLLLIVLSLKRSLYDSLSLYHRHFYGNYAWVVTITAFALAGALTRRYFFITISNFHYTASELTGLIWQSSLGDRWHPSPAALVAIDNGGRWSRNPGNVGRDDKHIAAIIRVGRRPADSIFGMDLECPLLKLSAARSMRWAL
jgi:hypothetical protein